MDTKRYSYEDVANPSKVGYMDTTSHCISYSYICACAYNIIDNGPYVTRTYVNSSIKTMTYD